MIKYSKIKLHSNNVTILKFIKLIKTLARKRQISITCKKLKENQKKYTILKSPHVNKKARDQIKTKSLEYIISFKNFKNFSFFSYFFIKKNNSNINCSFMLIVNQYYTLNLNKHESI
jgi:ribosomal protein S10